MDDPFPVGRFGRELAVERVVGDDRPPGNDAGTDMGGTIPGPADMNPGAWRADEPSVEMAM